MPKCKCPKERGYPKTVRRGNVWERIHTGACPLHDEVVTPPLAAQEPTGGAE